MMTHLDLVNAFILEFGVNGGKQITGIGAADNTQEAKRIAGFIADADFRIQSMFNNWRFMWRLFTGSISTGGILSQPAFGTDGYVFRMFDRDSLWFYPGTPQAYHPQYIEWQEYRRLFQPENSVQTPNNYPSAWTLAPNRQIYIAGVPNQALTYNIEGWAKPYRMKSDGDVSPIIRWLASHPMNKIVASANVQAQVVQAYNGPTAANERDEDGRIIIMRAAMIYSTVEGAMEVMQGATAEYESIMMELTSNALPGQQEDLSSENDIPQTIDPFL